MGSDLQTLDAAPSSLGPYRLEEVLGRGGMGEVYRAYDQRLDRRVAIKRIRRDKAAQSEARRRLRREARAAAALAHPSIVQVFDILETPDGDWIVMELIPGRTLADRLGAGPLEVSVAVGIARDLALGLAYAHARGFIHRDLKTENVMLAQSGGAKILDFGLAKNLEPDESTLTEDGRIVGTVRAMSPEQAMGLPLDGRSDLFSLGVLVYECLTARPLFQGESTAATLTRICQYEPEPLHRVNPEVPKALSRLVDRLLAKLPENRPASDEVLQRLESLGSDPARSLGISGEPTLDDDASQGALRRVRGHRAVSGVALLLLTAFGGWTLWEIAPAAGPHEMPRLPDDSPGDSHASFVEGMRLIEGFERPGDLDRAVNLFTELVEHEPTSASAHAGLAKAQWRKYRVTDDPRWLDNALLAARKAVELGEFVAFAHAVLGGVLLETQDLDAARASFETALRLDPTSIDAHLGVAMLHEMSGEIQSAEAAYRRALEVNPDHRFVLDALGTLLFKESRLDEAEVFFERSIEVAPENVFGYANLAGVHFMRDDLDRAASILQKGLEVRSHSYLYSNLGNIFFYQGRYEESIDPFKKAVELDHGSLNPVMWANLGDAYRWTPGHGDAMRAAYQRCIELLRGRLEKSPENPDLQAQLALYLARKGDWQDALEIAERLETSEELGASILHNLAETYEQSDQRGRALAMLDRALERGYPLSSVLREPELDRLRADPGFEALARRYGDEPAS
ncbi:MAG: protein kinase [Acidobacteriota bacterium]